MANDPIMNVAGNVNPDMMGSHAGVGLVYGRLKRNEERSRQFSDDRRLAKQDTQNKADLMTHEANLNDYQQRRAHGIDSDAELQSAGGHIGAGLRAAAAATTVMGPNGQMIGRSGGYNSGNGVNVNIGGFTAAAAKPQKQAARPAAPERERPTNVVNPADTNPIAGRQFGAVNSDVQGVYDLRNSPAGKTTKGAGKARAMEWGPLSKEDKEMDARRATPAEASQAEESLAAKPAKPSKVVKRAKAVAKIAAEEIL
jgi:hypothetical protein